jgi:hypothetical protein
VSTDSEIEKWGSLEFENLHYVTVETEREHEQPEYEGRINYVNEQPYDEEQWSMIMNSPTVSEGMEHEHIRTALGWRGME